MTTLTIYKNKNKNTSSKKTMKNRFPIEKQILIWGCKGTIFITQYSNKFSF